MAREGNQKKEKAERELERWSALLPQHPIGRPLSRLFTQSRLQS